MAFHMQLIAERAASAYADTIDATTNIQVFGTRGPFVRSSHSGYRTSRLRERSRGNGL